MRILHINSNFNSKHFFSQYSSLGARGIEQVIFYPYRSKRVEYKFDNLPITYVQQKIPKYSTVIFYSYKVNLVIKKINQIEDNNIDLFNLIHGHTLFSDGYPAYRLSLAHNINYVISFRETDLFFIKYKPWLKALGLKILLNASSIICISIQLKKELLKIYGSHKNTIESKITIVSNGISNEYYLNPLSDKSSFPDIKSLKLIYIGRFLKRKNVHQLIKLVRRNSNLKLTIIGGGGNYDSNIRRQIKRNLDKVVFHGKINDPNEIISILRDQDIFIMTSLSETFGISYIEALSQKLPIIYSKNTGIYGTFKEGRVGYAVNPSDPNEVLSAIEHIIDNYDKISENCYSEATRFKWENITNELCKIYFSLNTVPSIIEN